MKYFILASLLVVAVAASLEQGAQFQAFKLRHGKTYQNQVEEAKRFAIFTNNLRFIEEHNALYEQGQVTYKKGVNQFTDMTREEVIARLNLHPKPNSTMKAERYVRQGLAVPDSIDWRTLGRVTPVKDQGQCGSCWSFSITGTTEGAYARKTGQLVSLSEQQLIDCDSTSSGCNGGYLEMTYPYIQNNGLQSEDSYSYKAVNGQCQYDSSKVVTRVSSFKVISENEEDLLEAVATVGPISSVVNAEYIYDYASGIFSNAECSAEGWNHGILVVGYGSENGQDYWIVKNSWGTIWGESGYMRLLRGSNLCGITMDTSYPIID